MLAKADETPIMYYCANYVVYVVVKIASRLSPIAPSARPIGAMRRPIAKRPIAHQGIL